EIVGIQLLRDRHGWLKSRSAPPTRKLYWSLRKNDHGTHLKPRSRSQHVFVEQHCVALLNSWTASATNRQHSPLALARRIRPDWVQKGRRSGKGWRPCAAPC